MSDSNNVNSKVHRILKGISKPDKNTKLAPKRQGVNNTNVFIYGDININAIPVDLSKDINVITELQAYKIKTIVDEIAQLEIQNDQSIKQVYTRIWSALKNEMKVTEYKMIPQDRFDHAISYLDHLKAQSLMGNNETETDLIRKTKYKAIFTLARKRYGWGKDELYSYIEKNFSCQSVKELTMEELESLYSSLKTKYL